jgi:hypothetical protein
MADSILRDKAKEFAKQIVFLCRTIKQERYVCVFLPRKVYVCKLLHNKKQPKGCFFVGKRCVPLARNVIIASQVISPSGVMIAFGK